MKLVETAHRRRLEEALGALFADEAGLVEAIVADGWPEAMVKTGLALHQQTWNVDELVEAFEAELAPWQEGRRHHISQPETIAHIWPALPGAGVTPVLFGMLLGVEVQVRPSRRGRHFARYFCEKTGVALIDDDAWQQANVVVVSGSDETVAEVRRLVRPGTKVIGYGHRVSFALVVDAPNADHPRQAEALATDVVLWHQAGCFSCRAVIFVGSRERSTRFAAALGAAIAGAEQALEAHSLSEDLLARRAQAIGLARMQGPIYGDGIGWVQPTSAPFRGEQPSPHVVTLHRIDRLEELPEAIALPPGHLQGAALAIEEGDRRRPSAEAHLAGLGLTRICAPGALQGPPASWPHDGQPNMLGWLNITTLS